METPEEMDDGGIYAWKGLGLQEIRPFVEMCGWNGGAGHAGEASTDGHGWVIRGRSQTMDDRTSRP
jgi:hypothetical protein